MSMVGVPEASIDYWTAKFLGQGFKVCPQFLQSTRNRTADGAAYDRSVESIKQKQQLEQIFEDKMQAIQKENEKLRTSRRLFIGSSRPSSPQARLLMDSF